MGFFSRALLVFLMKESKKRRQKQPGKLMAKSHSQPVNLPGARPLMNPLPYSFFKYFKLHTPYGLLTFVVCEKCTWVYLNTKLLVN